MNKEELKQKAQSMLAELNEGIEKLEAKAQEIGDDIKVEYAEQVENLKGLKENITQKIKDIDDTSDDKWDTIKESAGNFLSSIGNSWKENYSKVAGAFKKDKDISEETKKDSDQEDYII
ncbi:MAG: hypothetical protein VB024_06215 [Dysgonamonadaceae bacterium]|jgi:ElaB/YqjD/DUF883 family membrane-anchored ribosome-binding protein|nr:hypothetical protein [Dysgonamonadaceae bacterium]MDD3308919.1 hypothetical protein [Dysgonamonadaceae bacterium]MDD3900226.1 hypothetical protein [Dysgonamonadaceae bacterium]MDD4398486.1 hypothetical protein [Dysgonamonadaceae bacterium]MEA5081204.1 hypothetical protein [Dysgonamonadaceae bacterium]